MCLNLTQYDILCHTICVLDFRLRGDTEFLKVVKVLEKKLHLKGGALLRHAVLKLYQLKKNGKNQYYQKMF